MRICQTLVLAFHDIMDGKVADHHVFFIFDFEFEFEIIFVQEYSRYHA